LYYLGLLVIDLDIWKFLRETKYIICARHMWLQPPDSLLKSMQNHFKACAQMIDEEAENIGKQKLNGQGEQNCQQGFRSSQNYTCVVHT